MNYKSLTTLFLITLCIFKSAYANDSTLIIKNAWIAEAPPVSKVMVAYMTFENAGKKAIEITSAESDMYSSIEFHETVHENGLARMKRHHSLNVAANTSLQLKQGGLHLMLFNPGQRLKAGDKVSLRFTTNEDLCQTVIVTVKKAKY